MSLQKQAHRNWITSHSEGGVRVMRRGPHIGVSIEAQADVVVLVPTLPDGSYIMGEVYRAIMDEISVEFPFSTMINDDAPADAAKLLSKLHTDADASECIPLGEILPSPGVLDTRIHLYGVKLSQPRAGKMIIPDGMLSLRAFSIQEITENIARGGINDAATIACLMRHVARSKDSSLSLATRMKDIEILDHKGAVLTTVKTNNPEWSFIQYVDENPGKARDWQFAIVPGTTSPTGEQLQVKSTVAFARRAAPPAPARPAYTPRPDQTAQHVEDDRAEDVIDDPDAVADEPVSMFVSRRTAPIAHTESEDPGAGLRDPEVPAQPAARPALFDRLPRMSAPIPEPAIDAEHSPVDPVPDAQEVEDPVYDDTPPHVETADPMGEYNYVEPAVEAPSYVNRNIQPHFESEPAPLDGYQEVETHFERRDTDGDAIGEYRASEGAQSPAPAFLATPGPMQGVEPLRAYREAPAAPTEVKPRLEAPWEKMVKQKLGTLFQRKPVIPAVVQPRLDPDPLERASQIYGMDQMLKDMDDGPAFRPRPEDKDA